MNGVVTRIVAAWAAATIGLMMSPPLASSADEHAAARGWQGTVRVRTLNVRGGPGEGYDIVGRLRRGDAVTAVDQTGRWVRLVGIGEPDGQAWVHRSFVRLPSDFMAPAFGDEGNAFLDWAAERGDLDQISIDGEHRLSLILAADTAQSRAAEIAREIGCVYRERLDVSAPVTVTVWTEEGPLADWVAQVTCP